MSEISGSLKTTSKGLGEVVEKSKAAADSVKETVAAAKAPIARLDGVVTKVDAAAAELKGTLTDIHKAAISAEKVLDSAKLLIANANAGKGTIGMLLTDKETRANLEALIRNLKERGVLFYRDKSK